MLIIFLVTAMLWITRDIINDIPGLEGLSDPGIAMLCGLALFLTPQKHDQNLLEWKDAQEGVPWELLLFGGGLSLAAATKHRSCSLDRKYDAFRTEYGIINHHVYCLDYISH